MESVSQKMRLREDTSWCLYVVECNNKALYTGISNNVPRRFLQHKRGKGARYTRNFGVKRLRFVLYGFSRPAAMKAEKILKTLPQQKKIEFFRIKPMRKSCKECLGVR